MEAHENNLLAVINDMKTASGFVKLAEQTHLKWHGDSANLVVLSEYPGGPGQLTLAMGDLRVLRDFLIVAIPEPVVEFKEPEVATKRK